MSDILKQLKASKYISTIDLSSAFNQIPLDEACHEYSAFTVPGRELLQFVRMPLVLSNPPATFQRLIDRVIGPELRTHAFCYLPCVQISFTCLPKFGVTSKFWLKLIYVKHRCREVGYLSTT